MLKQILTIAVMVTTFGLTSVSAQTVVYSDTGGKSCKRLSHGEAGNEWICPGPDGQNVVFVDTGGFLGFQFGDGSYPQPPFNPGRDQPFGKKIEWRLRDGKPYAAILRAYIGVENLKPDRIEWITHQVLVVTKIDGKQACHIAYVNGAVPNANAKAAEIADANAASFNCGSDTPLKIGDPAKFIE
jgi:hypothetical protein